MHATLERIGVEEKRRVWSATMVVLTVGAMVAAVLLRPRGTDEAGSALTWFLFVGASSHVAATGWYYTLPEVRSFASSHRTRYVRVPVVLVLIAGAAAAASASGTFRWLVLAFFAWQFFHFQRQNLGLVALAAAGDGLRLRPLERTAITAAGGAGIAALVSHPDLLQLSIDPHMRWLFGVAAVAYVGVVAVGIRAMWVRTRQERSANFLFLYAMSLGFFIPVFVFTSPYAAVAGLTLGHGLQYLLLTSLIASSGSTLSSRVIGPLVLFNVAVLGGLVLNHASHLHDGGSVERAIFGAYIGVVSAHFVIDAGLWRT